MADYSWALKTKNGDFYITVCGDWTQEEAALKMQLVMAAVGVIFISMVPRTRIPGTTENTGTIIQREKDKDGLGYQFFAGKKFWEVAKRSAEYEAEMILLGKQLEERSG